MTLHRAEESVKIEAPPDACFEAIVDYETFPEWQDAVLATEVMERDADGLGKVVEVHVDAKFREVTYRLRYHYQRPHRVWWEFIQGEGIEHVEGEYLLEPIDGGTRATYKLAIDPGVPIPGIIARRLHKGVMRRSVQDLKRRVES